MYHRFAISHGLEGRNAECLMSRRHYQESALLEKIFLLLSAYPAEPLYSSSAMPAQKVVEPALITRCATTGDEHWHG